MIINGEKAKHYLRNLTRSLSKSQEETTKHKKVCQPTDLQTEEDCVIKRSLLEDADFHLAPLLLTKIYLKTATVLTPKLRVYSKKTVIKLI